jgi:hypothetical protein
MVHLLDTSALLAYYFEEGGAEKVQNLLADTKNPPAICCITELEFWARLKSLDAEAHFQSDWSELSDLLKSLPMDARIVGRAVEIRRASPNRLPPWTRSSQPPPPSTGWSLSTAIRILNTSPANFCGKSRSARPRHRNHKMFRRLHLFIDANLARAASLPVWNRLE